MRKKNEAEWVQKEVEGCDFGDRRLGKRCEKLLAALSGRLGYSLPLACQDRRTRRRRIVFWPMRASVSERFWPAIFRQRGTGLRPRRGRSWCSMTRPSSALPGKMGLGLGC